MHQTLEFLGRHGYLLLFAMVLAEQLGAPIPSVPVLIAMGALVGSGTYSLGASMGYAVLAAVAADGVWYIIGRQKGPSVLRLLCKISLEPDSCVSNTRGVFKRLGGWALVIAKFVPGLSTVAPPMAGLSRMPWWKFLSADTVGSTVWAGAFLSIGFTFRTQLEEVGDLALRTGSWVLVIVAGALAGWIGFKYWQRRRFIKSLRVARITPEEVLEKLKDVVVLDLRTSTEVELDGLKIQGALWFDRQTLEAHHQEIPRDRDVVLYCT